VTELSLLVARKPLELDVLPRKPLKLHAFYRQCVASRLLHHLGMRTALAAGMLASSGCLLPQESHILQPVPPTQNRPPRIIEDQVFPSRVVHTPNGPDCSLHFSLYASDPDLEDTLYVRWYAYMNFQDNLPPLPADQVIQPDSPPSEIRNTSAVLNIDFSAADNPLRQEGTYAVEALVADGPLVNRTPQPRVLPDGTVLTTYAVSYAWAVEVRSGPCTP